MARVVRPTRLAELKPPAGDGGPPHGASSAIDDRVARRATVLHRAGDRWFPRTGGRGCRRAGGRSTACLAGAARRASFPHPSLCRGVQNVEGAGVEGAIATPANLRPTTMPPTSTAGFDHCVGVLLTPRASSSPCSALLSARSSAGANGAPMACASTGPPTCSPLTGSPPSGRCPDPPRGETTKEFSGTRTGRLRRLRLAVERALPLFPLPLDAALLPALRDGVDDAQQDAEHHGRDSEEGKHHGRKRRAGVLMNRSYRRG